MSESIIFTIEFKKIKSQIKINFKKKI